MTSALEQAVGKASKASRGLSDQRQRLTPQQEKEIKKLKISPFYNQLIFDGRMFWPEKYFMKYLAGRIKLDLVIEGIHHDIGDIIIDENIKALKTTRKSLLKTKKNFFIDPKEELEKNKMEYSKKIKLKIKKEDLEYVGGLIYHYNGKPFTGIAEDYYESGKLSSEANYKNGMLNGLSKSFNKSGELDGQINFKDGEMVDEDGNVIDFFKEV